MPIIQADRLTRIGAALLKAAGASDEEASAVASGCVNANLAGHDSHGVIAIPTYIDRITAGHIVPGAKWTIVQESPTTTVIDGHWGFGFHVNAKAMELTIAKAKTANVAACTVFRQSHVGRLAHYPMMAMREGMIGIATADSGRSPKHVAPFGGREARLGTNPISIAVPSDLSMRGNGGVGEIGPAAADRTSVLEQRLEVGREDRIAVVDGILRITDQMREAELVLLGVPQLRGQPVRQPHLGLHATEKVCRHALAARRCDHMIDSGGAAERPLPPGLTLHARTRLVAGDPLACAHLCCDPLGRRCDGLADTSEHVGDSALRDCEAEQALADLGEPLEADHLAAVQVGDHRRDTRTERRAFGHIRRCARRHPRLAAGAGGAEQLDARRDR